MSYRTGLVSITFRKLSPREIVELVAKGGLGEIEWGGDIHVPHGDVAKAREVRELTADAGLATAAYGSYYRLGKAPGADGPEFAAVLESAVALGAPTIRVWPGTKGSAEADQAYRDQVAAEAVDIAEQAATAGISISLEYHANTLTDTTESAAALLLAAPHPNLYTLWQPPNGSDPATAEASLKSILPRLSNVHCFHWWPTAKDRHLLAGGWERWKPYFHILRAAGKEPAFLLEFVKGDDPVHFLQDAATLREWVSG
jgi:3-dehydroshikimate dehydratase